ncbi:ATP-binding protein [Streptomyces sp. NPDC049585]|uniref:ATP-binding protein n=1 Tax=Streptomyces sp. NPDC049585 TaxID=3155154 RepID=UPI003431EEDD
MPTLVSVDAPAQYVWWRLPRHARSAARARALLRERARLWQLPAGTAETAVLLLSELVANACRHARVSPGRQIHALCVVRGEKLRIEVSDAGDGFPCVRELRPLAEAGRGLRVVAALADAWGAVPRPYGIGKTVWCELTIGPDGSGAHAGAHENGMHHSEGGGDRSSFG